MNVYVVIEIFPKKEVLNPETEAVKKSLSNLGFNNVSELLMSKKIKIKFKDLSREKCVIQTKKMCEKILVNTNIQEYEISVVEG